MTHQSPARPPLWRDVRVLAWAFQIVVVAVVVAVVWFLYGTYQDNAEAKNLTDRVRLPRPAGGVPDPVQRLPHDPTGAGRHRRGPQNTLRLAITGIVLSTVLGTLIGVARLSQNFILRSAAKAYVEIIRNVPLLALVLSASSRSSSTPSRRRTSRGRSARSPCSTSAARACSGSRARTGSSSRRRAGAAGAVGRGPLAARRRRPHGPPARRSLGDPGGARRAGRRLGRARPRRHARRSSTAGVSPAGSR